MHNTCKKEDNNSSSTYTKVFTAIIMVKIVYFLHF